MLTLAAPARSIPKSRCNRSESLVSVTDPQTPEKLYAAREPIFPRRVSGTFRNLKWVIMAVTLGIYYLTPWIR